MPREPIHPGEILADELTELSISAAELAGQIKVPAKKSHYRRYGLADRSVVWNGA